MSLLQQILKEMAINEAKPANHGGIIIKYYPSKNDCYIESMDSRFTAELEKDLTTSIEKSMTQSLKQAKRDTEGYVVVTGELHDAIIKNVEASVKSMDSMVNIKWELELGD